MAAPINNAFADAIQVDILTIGATFTDSVGSDEDATWQTGEPVNTTVGGYRSVWWKYTPAHSGPVKISKNSTGALNRIYLTAYTGTAVNAIAQVYTPNRNINVYEFDGIAGVTYYIRHSRYSTSYAGDAGIIVEGETTVPSRVPGAPALTLVPEDNTLLVKWAKGIGVDWEITLDGGASIPLGQVGSHTFTGLTIGQTYTIAVRGTNTVGSGGWSTRTIKMPNMFVFDSFTRANSASVVGTGEVGPAAISALGTNGINANQLYTSALSSNVGIVYWECGETNVDIRVKRAAGAQNSGGIFFGATSATDGWYAYFNSDGPGYIGTYRGATAVQMMAMGGGPVVNTAAVLRLVHHNGIVQAWADSTLLLEATLPEPVRGTRHGVRSTATTHRWDDLTIRESSEITLEADTAAMVTQYAVTTEFEPPLPGSFVYKGRDTKAQDQAGIG